MSKKEFLENLFILHLPALSQMLAISWKKIYFVSEIYSCTYPNEGKEIFCGHFSWFVVFYFLLFGEGLDSNFK